MAFFGIVTVAGLELLEESNHARASEFAPQRGQPLASNLVEGLGHCSSNHDNGFSMRIEASGELKPIEFRGEPKADHRRAVLSLHGTVGEKSALPAARPHDDHAMTA